MVLSRLLGVVVWNVKIKADTGLKSRCIIGDNETSICPVCGKPSKYDIYFAKQY